MTNDQGKISLHLNVLQIFPFSFCPFQLVDDSASLAQNRKALSSGEEHGDSNVIPIQCSAICNLYHAWQNVIGQECAIPVTC